MSAAHELKRWLREKASIKPQFMEDVLDIFRDEHIGDVDDLMEFETLPRFNNCLPALTAHKIRSTINRSKALGSSSGMSLTAHLANASKRVGMTGHLRRGRATIQSCQGHCLRLRLQRT